MVLLMQNGQEGTAQSAFKIRHAHYSSETTKPQVLRALRLIVLPFPVSQPNQFPYCYEHQHTVLILNVNVIYRISLPSQAEVRIRFQYYLFAPIY